MISVLQVTTPRLGTAPASGVTPKEQPAAAPAPGDAFKPAPQENLSSLAQIKKKLFDGSGLDKIFGGLFGAVIGGVGGALGGTITGAVVGASYGAPILGPIVGFLAGGVIGGVLGGYVGSRGH